MQNNQPTPCCPWTLCRHGGTFKCLKHLLRHKLVHHDNSKCVGAGRGSRVGGVLLKLAGQGCVLW